MLNPAHFKIDRIRQIGQYTILDVRYLGACNRILVYSHSNPDWFLQRLRLDPCSSEVIASFAKWQDACDFVQRTTKLTHVLRVLELPDDASLGELDARLQNILYQTRESDEFLLRGTNMKLDGKYAVVNRRKIAEITNVTTLARVTGAIEVLLDAGVLELDSFFVLKLKYQFAQPALIEYADAICHHDPEFANEVYELSRQAYNHPERKLPD